MKIETVSISDLSPLENNVRNHTPTQIRELTRSFKQFGQTRPVVIDEANNILIGNGFYMALKSLGETKIEAYRIKGLTEIQKKKLVLSDNRTFSIGLDDFDGITNYINEIVASGDFEVAGYDESVLKEMTRTLDEITSDMNSQGVIPQQEVEEMNKAFNRAEQVLKSAPAQNQEQRYVNAPEVMEETTSAARTNSNKSVICPNCGEVIYID